MAYFYDEPSRTFNEYLLVPGYSSAECVPSGVNLKTPVARHRRGEESPLSLNVPLASAIMQSVSNDTLAIALAKQGGLSFVYCSQSVEAQAEMVRKVKTHKAGFVTSDSNIKPDRTLREAVALKAKTGHSTIAVTADGTAHGALLGIITSRDFRINFTDGAEKVRDYMTPFKDLIVGTDGIALAEANDLIWKHKLNALPVVSPNGELASIVFRKDYSSHEEHPLELLDANHRYMVGAGINTRDYMERVPALLAAGADALCLDSSEGYTEWQKRALADIRRAFGGQVIVGAGNVVDRDGFRFLAEAGAGFVKVGIGGGSICITREQKGIGRGQATAVIDVARARDEYCAETGVYVPLCADGGIVFDYHITLALAMGADFVMLGRYFARFDESPTNRLMVNGAYVKEYWGEGSNRARNWQRYDVGGAAALEFEEGVDSYVPYAGSLKDNVSATLSKIRHAMCNCGVRSIRELQANAKITLVSEASIAEGSFHDVIAKNAALRQE